jgi:hypothetical protein
MAKFAVDINTYFTVEGETKEQVEEFVRANFYVAEIEKGELEVDMNDYGIEIKEMN